jgi:predicted ribosome quality control (RQC) complex YloA/Tae2 family protein
VSQGNITEYSEISDWIDGADDDGDDDNHHECSETLRADFERWTQAVDEAVGALQKKRNSLQSELEKAQGVEDTMARAQLLVSNLYVFNDNPSIKTAKVMDWERNEEIELTLNDKYESASAEADALFAQARKLKRGSQVVADLLEETASAWETLQSAQEDLQSAILENDNLVTVDEGRFALVKDRLIRTARTTKFQVPSSDDSSDGSSGSKRNSSQQRQRKPELGTPASNIRKLKSPGGCTIYVGRNRRGNEYLSLSLARGNDIWMHSRGCPGAHVLILNRRGGPPVTDDCLQLAADLAIFYSDLRNEAKAEVTAAEPKHILKPRGAPLGAVKIREEWKTFVGRPDRVPEELKMAREESGQTDEYHMMDKAKHRRRTKQAAEDDQNKRRQRQREKRSGP